MKQMKMTKPQSLTTDTRLSQSHFFNNSSLNRTNLTTTSQKNNNNLTNTFQHYESKETDHFKVKNEQLQDRVKRMSHQIKQLQQNKINLLKINQKYVKVVNKYYRDLHRSQLIAESSKQISINERGKDSSKEKISSNLIRQKSSSNYNSFNVEQSRTELVLTQLEKNHRNLVKHCLVMESQIRNYANQMGKFNKFKAQLLAVNHTTPSQLITQLQETTLQNKQLKKQNNRLSFELQKCKAESNKLKKTKQTQNKHLASNGQESEKLKAQINKVTQQSSDKSNLYQQRIYQLELKVQKLEKQLRSGQQFVYKNQQRRKNLQIQRVEDVHENCYLKANLTELLDPKKHPLLSIDRSFVYKKKNEKTASLNKTLTNHK